ncbi:MAG TPA: cobalt ECF transporter S component CbiM [Methanothermococcus okinawensis]|uniref:Putative cobalt transport protein CbiM n=1 Tax=Methanothermococcus okinawensis TaxID=155863 RepID=A0A832ZDD3_9EURY|nr:cobalt ECF transporter S component CbiM [Methanococcaceae archaeon]HIP84924.1 cobalt ECF transporter S component CbiM [Methanothermococcus okinawensis]HIP91171.1 cobalt ECF transporter S component CbiM [Methanothermococcus okinawensis]
MHIMEGYLPPMWCAIWYILSGIVVGYGIIKINKLLKEMPEVKPLLAVAGAYMFVLSSLKLPSVTGSCSHPCGNGLSAVLFGVAITAVLATIVLLFQALLLAHGGLTTLGANIFSMGVMGPLAGVIVWKLLRGKVSSTIAVMLAAIASDWMTYVTTAIQLTLAFPGDDPVKTLITFLSIFAVTQIPLAIAEGLLTAIIWDKIKELRPDLLLKLGVIDESEVPHYTQVMETGGAE